MARILTLIAEDEKIIRENLAKKIVATDSDFEIGSMSKNGIEALKEANNTPIDVLFTDIRMPLMDGLDLIKHIKQLYPDIQIVIISGYADFSYAQTALRFGVTDYLLKPVKGNELKDILIKIKSKYHQDKEAMLKKHLRLAATSNRYSIPCDYFTANKTLLCLLTIGNICDNVSLASIRSLYAEELSDAFKQDFQFQNVTIYLIDGLTPNTRLLFIPLDEKQCIESFTKNLFFYLKQLFTRLNVNLYYCALTNSMNLFDQIHNLYYKMRHLLVLDGSSCIDINKVCATSISCVISPPLRYKISQSIEKKQHLIFNAMLGAEISNILTSKYPQYYLLDYIFQILKLFQELSANPIDAEIFHLQYTFSNYLALPNSSPHLFEKLCDELTNLFSPSAKESTESITQSGLIQSYIIKNYNSDITLGDLAKEFNFTPSHIIRIFKKQFRETPMKYIIYLRIEKAKALLLNNTSLDIKQVGEYVGYSDSHYFSRIFKSVVGVTPSEYKLGQND